MTYYYMFNQDGVCVSASTASYYDAPKGLIIIESQTLYDINRIRNNNGKIIEVNEIQSAKHFDEKEIDMLETIASMTEVLSTLQLDIETIKGEKEL